MKSIMTFIRDTRHLAVLAMLIAAIATGFFLIRPRMIPETYGQVGPYREAALAELAERPSVLQGDAVCLKCHDKVGAERAESLHKVVRCIHCHGLGVQHVAEAEKAATSPDAKPSPAQPWDGNFQTSIDLYVTKDRATCLSCHEEVVGMPKAFRKINVKSHLEEQGASEPESRETCFECHGGHNTAP